MSKPKKYFRVTASSSSDFYMDIKAGSKEEIEEKITNGEIDGGDMKEDGIGGWTWEDIVEITKNEYENE